MKTADKAIQTTLSLVEDIFGSSSKRNFAVQLWDGTIWKPEAAEPTVFTIILQHPGALRAMFLPPTELNIAEAYIYNDYDIVGDIEAFLQFGLQFLDASWGAMAKLRYGARLLSLPHSSLPRPGEASVKLRGEHHSRERDRQAIQYHYSRSNDFFALFLDAYMVYSCGYFLTPDEDLDTAQERKLDYICRKLRLRPGERLLDIGCGWGGLVIYAAQHYGVEAYGVTLSQAQAEFAQKRIQEAGLEDRCRVDLRDYRDVNELNAFDKIASVGMYEHVGAALLPQFFKHIWKLLPPGGVLFVHGFASETTLQPGQAPSFASQYIVPDAEFVPLSRLLRAVEESGFEIRDVESMRDQYILSWRNWLNRLEANADEARTITSDVFYRIWRLFLSGAVHFFKIGRENAYHTLLLKPDRGESHLPLTRADWYA
jgi:cyclopropane-fatty-acyl-phospholipid synthase